MLAGEHPALNGQLQQLLQFQPQQSASAHEDPDARLREMMAARGVDLQSLEAAGIDLNNLENLAPLQAQQLAQIDR